MVLLEHNPVTIRGRSVLPVFKEMKESTSILRREMENIKKRPNMHRACLPAPPNGSGASNPEWGVPGGILLCPSPCQKERQQPRPIGPM